MTQEEKAKAKPILFSTKMVKAILDNRKTVTRRVVKNGNRTPTGIERNKFYTYVDTLNGKPFYGAGFYKDSDIFIVDGVQHIDAEYFKMPYKIGDVLYVRETWAKISDWTCVDEEVGCPDGYIYKAEWRDSEHPIWHPSLHMPKEAARIFLRVTDVRVERLRDITAEQIINEGINIGKIDKEKYVKSKAYAILADNLPIARFADLWDNTIKKKDLPLYGWDASPWVWVISFEVIEK